MPEVSPSKYLVQAGWEDVPHLDKKAQKELLESTPPYLRDARSKGSPSLGAGAIYPVELSEILVDAFQIPVYWPRCYALDVGWNRTACLWGAFDRSIDRWYLYTEHYRGKAEASIHTTAIKARGDWIPGLIDPAARGRSQHDGKQLMAIYISLGLKLELTKNAVEAGLYDGWERLSTGRLKVFRTLQNWQAEYRLYRRDQDGDVIKQFDHLMDCTRYLILSGRSRAIPYPVDRNKLGGRSAGDPALGF